MDISSNFHDLFEKKVLANLATLMSDGSPHITPVWIDFDGVYLIVNTVKGRVKDRNMRKNRQVAISIIDPDNPYRYLGIRGRVEIITEEGAKAHLDKLAKKYLNITTIKKHKDIRVLFKIKPEKVFGNDPN